MFSANINDFMNQKRLLYITVICASILMGSCRQSKYVGEGNYLLKKNEIFYAGLDKDSSQVWAGDHELIDEGAVSELIRPEKNSKFKLFVYNRIDTVRYKNQLQKKTEKTRHKNEKRQNKEDKINKKRIEKARDNGKKEYKRKTIAPKSTKLGWRNWLITHWGQSPVILDTVKIAKTEAQIKIYLSQRGFKNAVVTDTIILNEGKKKATVQYYVDPKEPLVINSIKFDNASRNSFISKQYDRMVEKEWTDIQVGGLLDEADLDAEREHYTTYMKDHAFFGFTKNYVSFVVDSTIGNHRADVVIYVHEKMKADSSGTLPHMSYKVNRVIFKLSNADSLSFKDFERYKQRCKDLGIDEYYSKKEGYALLDTTVVIDTLIRKRYITFNPDIRKAQGVKIFEAWLDTLTYNKGTFIYNEEAFVKPSLLDKQNFLEPGEYAKDYYIERSFRSMLRLDVFERITPSMEVTPGQPNGSTVDVTYELKQAQRQEFIIEPRATNTQSILGISGEISYANKNLFRNANQLKVTLSGGFQSQPLVAGDDTQSNNNLGIRGLNTFEWGPEITYNMPRFYPLTKKQQQEVSKRSFPSTTIGVLYNHQKRSEFDRHIGEASYKWKLSSPDFTQIFTIIPTRFDYVFINKDSAFNANLAATNDPFLINSYSNFLSLGVLGFGHHYNNLKKKKAERTTPHTFDNDFLFTGSGLVVNGIHALTHDSLSYLAAFNKDAKELFAVTFSQFVKLENTFTFNQFINKRHRLVYRALAGVGYAYGNGISLPYTQSFVAGGSNDIRAFDARTMAPGGTKTYANPNSTTTQIGDMKLELNLEWRFKMFGIFNGAVFVDAGNIWKVKGDAAIDAGVFTFGTFGNQVAIGTGFGLRADLDFLIVRLDFAWKIHNPYLPEGNRWWLNSDHTEYNTYFDVDTQGNKIDYIKPHGWRFNFGIGYPF
jgi:outer membrane protein assembly factor BamA